MNGQIKEEKYLIANKKGDVSVRTDDLIEAKYQLSAKANDIVDMVMAEVQDDDNLRYEIYLSKYADYYKDKPNIYRDFKKVVSLFKDKGVYIKESNGDETYYPWFSKIKYINKQGKILVDLHPEMKSLILSSKRGIYFGIKDSINITNEYAKKYYYCCKLYSTSNGDKSSGFRNDRLNELQDKLEVPNSYRKSFAKFEKYVLKVAVEQINIYSDLIIDYKPKKTGRNITHIITNIRLKTKEQKEEDKSKILFVKEDISLKVNLDKPLRLQVLDMLKPNEEIVLSGLYSKPKSADCIKLTKVKETIAEQLDMSVKNITRYVNINYKLIKEFIDLFDKNFITLGQAEKYANMSQDTQIKEYKKIKLELNKMSKYLCDELAGLLQDYKISYNVAEKYSKKPIDEQIKYYNKNFKNKDTIIDSEYKEVEKETYLEKDNYIGKVIKDEICLDLDTEESIEIKNDINIEEQKNLKIIKDYIIAQGNITGATDKIIEEIYINSEENVNYVKYIIDECQKQASYGVEIYKPLMWIKEMVKPNVYQKPLKPKNDKKLNFDNFEGRQYSIDEFKSLEKKLLGWDNDDE